MAYVIIFPQEQKEILTFQPVKYAITKQVGRNCIQFLQPQFCELAFHAPYAKDEHTEFEGFHFSGYRFSNLF